MDNGRAPYTVTLIFRSEESVRRAHTHLPTCSSRDSRISRWRTPVKWPNERAGLFQVWNEGKFFFWDLEFFFQRIISAGCVCRRFRYLVKGIVIGIIYSVRWFNVKIISRALALCAILPVGMKYFRGLENGNVPWWMLQNYIMLYAFPFQSIKKLVRFKASM